PAIPPEVFGHPLAELRELDARDIEHLGRLGSPIHKRAGSDRFEPISWDNALDVAAQRLRDTDPDRSFFYASGRSSNEAGFLFQLVARLYGTNNVSNCSYYCHQATSVALGSTIGTGTATVELADLTRCDLIVVIGANPSSNHPRFIHKLKACRERGGHVVVINPAKEPGLVKFAVPKSPRSMIRGGDEIASLYIQPKVGEDIALFKAIAKMVIARGGDADSFIAEHTEGFDAYRQDLDAESLDALVQRCGVSREQIDAFADIYCHSQQAVFAWGMGMTHHLHGVENIESIANLALLRGMIGRPGAGLLPLRGHSNVQGIGTIGVKPVLAADVVDKLQSHLDIELPEKPGLDTMAAMHAASEGAMDAAVLMGGNLYAANPNSAWAEDALGQIGFRLHLTTTLNHSHVVASDEQECLVLPVTARDEEWEPTTQESMFNYVRLSDGGIRRLPNTRPESVVLAGLAERLLPDCPVDFASFAKHKSLREAIAATVPGMEPLQDLEVARREFHVRSRVMHAPRFNTASGKGAFKTIALPALNRKRPYRLTTVRSEGQFNSIVYEHKDSYRGTADRWVVMLNGRDVEALGLRAGGRATLRSDDGVMEDVLVHAYDLPEGCAMAYYPEANALTGTQVDPRSKTPAFKMTAISIEPA
ncbi:MAG: FdhF/YdeP family oxidoreductase, partial [Devosiaceae bacterium]|nr:FdhF/YdeP family oxidoreductase [Devosiaceae bacterium MH13]